MNDPIVTMRLVGSGAGLCGCVVASEAWMEETNRREDPCAYLSLRKRTDMYGTCRDCGWVVSRAYGGEDGCEKGPV